jgi:hypothetical protein
VEGHNIMEVSQSECEVDLSSIGIETAPLIVGRIFSIWYMRVNCANFWDL